MKPVPCTSALAVPNGLFSAVSDKIRQAKALANAVASGSDEADSLSLSRLNIELLHALLLKMLLAEENPETGLDMSPREVYLLSNSLMTLVRASKAEGELRDKLGTKLEKSAKKRGLSKETIETLKKDVFGAL